MYEACITISKKEKYKNNSRSARFHQAVIRGLNPHNNDFVCASCHRPVNAGLLAAGVNNRNHCPYCLASRHLDWRDAGDRLSACKAVMQPLALSFKQTKKRFGSRSGELMLVHRCVECGKVSANRLAADDDAERLWEIFEISTTIDNESRLQIESGGISLIPESRRRMVYAQLFGNSFPDDEIDFRAVLSFAELRRL